VARKIIRDELSEIAAQLRAWIADPEVDVVIATGGTGVTGRDVTPEAFHSVYEKEVAGFGELFRWLSFDKIGTSTIQSRATAGVAGGTYLFALPGSPSACRDAWEGILVHQLDNRFRPCNFVELMPRLQGHLKGGEFRDVAADEYRRAGRAGGQRAAHALAEVALALCGDRHPSRPDPRTAAGAARRYREAQMPAPVTAEAAHQQP